MPAVIKNDCYAAFLCVMFDNVKHRIENRVRKMYENYSDSYFTRLSRAVGMICELNNIDALSNIDGTYWIAKHPIFMAIGNLGILSS